eukprot:GHUV01013202.1.p1 GENE.GHUV01013202.1~~GHUV01013202.1.p1  ORF type:complete len:366 (+),score=116.23 GHUV01013202.1:142-1098(+)
MVALLPTYSACFQRHSSSGQCAAVCQHQHSRHVSTAQQAQQAAADAAQGPSSSGTMSGSEATTQNDPNLLLNTSGRFYDTVAVAPYEPAQQEQERASSSDGYQLLLGKYPIKTPAKNLLVLPTYSLALAVAAEWEWLPKGKPIPHLMPLTSLAATATDQPRDHQKVVEHLLKYVHTDSACIRYEPGPLQRRQAMTFDPLLHWAKQELGWELHTSDSIAGTTQPRSTVAAVQKYLQGLDNWQMAAFEQLTTASKSIVLAAAAIHQKVTAAEAVDAARLEEDFQLEDWGMVEAGHDLDIADTKTRIGAPIVFHKLLSSTH